MRSFTLFSLIGLLAMTAPTFADDMQGMSMGQRPVDEAYRQSMQTMMKDMQAEPTGDADKDFVTMMIPHHQGAIDMAKIELQSGKDPMLRKMAQGIIKAQEAEIAEMKAWQKKKAK